MTTDTLSDTTTSPSPLHRTTPVTPDVEQVQTLLVNLYLIGTPGSPDWVLLDAGIPGFSSRIASAARQRFGPTPPKSITLTHGHFDHVGSLHALLQLWPDTPVYAHELELPYLDGRSPYPPPDPSVGGGLLARSSPLFPSRPYDFRPNLRPLPVSGPAPTTGPVPDLPGWRWIHTPGHSPGHVSLFRDADRTLLAGDAFTTQKQESLLAVLTNHLSIHGPPAYFTIDWQAAEQSVHTLRDLHPTSAATGHGLPLHSPDLTRALDYLVDHFHQIALPRHGRYVPHPARTDTTGPTYIPPKPFDPFPYLLGGAIALATAATLYATKKSHDTRDSHWLDT